MHNFGRDISKFFYGGYNLVNVKGKQPHHHSQPALDIVKSMIVGVLKGQEQVADHPFHITDKVQINENTATFTFTTASGQPIHNLKNWYNDPTMIGKHFLVYSKS